MKNFCLAVQAVFIFLALILLAENNYAQKIDTSKIIVFDDLERSKIDLQAKLGIINFYVEHCGCAVIVIAHDDKITKEFDESKEKVFGQTIRILPKIDDALHSFVSAFSKNKIVIHDEHAKTIKKLFVTANCNSLRVLRQLLYDAARFCELFEVKQIENTAKFESLLELFIAFDVEVRSGNLKREDISSRETAHLLAIAAKMDKGSTTPDLKKTVVANRFLISRSKFESVLDLNSLDLSDDILIQTTVDGQYNKNEIQEFVNSNFYFKEQDEQPAWLRFMNFRTNQDSVVNTAAKEMDGQFANRSCDNLGEFLHIVSLRFMRSQNKLISDDFEKIESESKSYLDDLVKQGRFPITFYDGILGNYPAHGEYSFWEDESYWEHFNVVRSYIRECHSRTIELKMPEFKQELLDLLANDPEKFIATLGRNDAGIGKYDSLPVLNGIGVKEFVNRLLTVPFDHWRALYFFLEERMRKSKIDQSLIGEQKWFVDLVAEMNDRVAALGNTIAALRLKRHIPEGK